MFSGRIVGIYVAPVGAAPMEPRQRIAALEALGLEGDRYAERTGTYSRVNRFPRDVTLIEREAIAAVRSDYDVELSEQETRRNLVTEAVPLNQLVAVEFTVGAVLLRGIRLAEPCAHLERLTRAGVRAPLVHRGGLHATVLRPGTITIGDVVEPAGSVPSTA